MRSITFALALIAICLAGCSGQGGNTSNATTSQPTSVVTPKSFNEATRVAVNQGLGTPVAPTVCWPVSIKSVVNGVTFSNYSVMTGKFEVVSTNVFGSLTPAHTTMWIRASVPAGYAVSEWHVISNTGTMFVQDNELTWTSPANDCLTNEKTEIELVLVPVSNG